MSDDIATLPLVWQQGEDLAIQMIYEEGPDVSSTTPVNLTGYSLRMDIKTDTGLRLTTFNSQALQDVDPIAVGDQADPTTEATLGTAGQINIVVSRIHTLPPGGAIYQQMASPTPKTVFQYDIFLRNTLDKQIKILQGTITVERSVTLWP
jgi:hypothetical protein